ncbi:hypothetical protein J3R30DRAFT_132208 [Lentinula aciculospora]|uniref:Glycoside hydrolase family 76 protein n=1 Tax=Lentinula aciculospora TaxID=153920 RepID=A0A9W9AUC1_9AGAR|nr:hypothetical protein J3R30DRAFT_132208 [Lentinula aciculospora]
MVGGVFWETDADSPSLDGLGTGYFLVLSALLAEVTSNQTYLNAAQNSATFVHAHLYNIQDVVQDTISARQNDSCSTSVNTGPYNAGLTIEGLATLYSITQNATTQSLLDNTTIAAIQSDSWVLDNGIIAYGSQKVGDLNLARGLLVAYNRNATNVGLRGYIEAFLAVQYNALVDLATANGTNIYTFSWLGPPSNQISPLNQTSALTVLIGAIYLQNGSTPASPPITSTPSPTIKPIAIPQSTPSYGAIAGGIIGGLIILITLIAFLVYLYKRGRRQTGKSDSKALEPFAFGPYATMLPLMATTQSGIGTYPMAQNPTSKRGFRDHQRSFFSIGGRERHLAEAAIPGKSSSPTVFVNPEPSPAAEGPTRPNVQAQVVERAREVITTEELVRLLNERLQAGEWDASELPPIYPNSERG